MKTLHRILFHTIELSFLSIIGSRENLIVFPFVESHHCLVFIVKMIKASSAREAPGAPAEVPLTPSRMKVLRAISQSA